jgi:plasmid stability protein
MGSPLQIRNVPEETHRTLKARAATRGQSLNAYLLELVTREAERPTAAEVLARAASRAERAQASATEALSEARAGRDEQLQRRAGT